MGILSIENGLTILEETLRAVKKLQQFVLLSDIPLMTRLRAIISHPNY